MFETRRVSREMLIRQRWSAERVLKSHVKQAFPLVFSIFQSISRIKGSGLLTLVSRLDER
jgi:hypothetical protein